MSHFTVLVIGPDIEKQLAPFQENNMGDCPDEFLQFYDTETEMLDAYENKSVTRVIMPDGSMKLPWDDCFRVPGNGVGFGPHTHVVPEHLEQRDVPFKETYATFEEYVKDWHGSEGRDPLHNRFGYYENPNRKWDWYSIGGRWTGFFKLKPGANGKVGRPGLMTKTAAPGYADQCMKKDVDFDAMRDEAGQAAGMCYDFFLKLMGLSVLDRVAANVFGTCPFTEKPWKKWCDIVAENPNSTRDERIAIYESQEMPKRFEDAKKAFRAKNPYQRQWNEVEEAVLWGDADDFACTRAEYVQRARNRAFSTYAVVKDAKWFEKGEMCWWGRSAEKMEEDKWLQLFGWWGCTEKMEEDKWLQRFNDLLDSLDDETLLTVVDCHI
jgi:hypothetical protein